MQAMILAAGFGTRLLPFTRYKPKPLFPLLNISLLELTIGRLKEAGFDYIIVNTHHLSDQLCRVLGGIEGVVIQEEPVILGTGGGLRKACDVLRNEPLLVTNGDIYHTIDTLKLYRDHSSSQAPVTMAVHRCQRFNSLLIDGEHLRSFDGRGHSEALAFTGLHVVDPDILLDIPTEEKSCIITRYRRLLESDMPIAVRRQESHYWTDIGTMQDYLDVHGGLLQKTIPSWPGMSKRVTPPAYIAAGASVGEGLEVENWACIGNATLGKGVKVARSVIWDGAEIPDSSTIRDSLVTPWTVMPMEGQGRQQ